MDSIRGRSALAGSGLLIAGAVIAIGTAWAFERGGYDFNVFYQAWSLVLSGRGDQIYALSPDRFLYAPGFAYLLSPFALLPRDLSLLAWCLAKAAVVGWMLSALGQRMIRLGAGTSAWQSAGIAAWSIVLLARPVLIDYQYGQVNLFILAACVWAMIRYLEPARPAETVAAWAVLSFAALAKVFPLPLLLLPWVQIKGRKWERLGTIVGCALVLSLPLIARGPEGALSLYQQWREALLSRGMPLESHNQSFAAFAHHFLSGAGTRVIARGSTAALLNLGRPWLSPDAVSLLSWGWTLVTTGVLLAGILNPPLVRQKAWPWMTWLIGMLIVPSHLIWKPYFVFGIPAAICAIGAAGGPMRPRRLIALFTLFALVNLTVFDVLGPEWGARAEAASLLLGCHLALLGLAALGPPHAVAEDEKLTR